MADVTTSNPHRSTWLARLRWTLALAVLWGLFSYVTDATVLPRGLSRPLLILIGDGGVAAAIVTLLLLAVGTLLGTVLCGGSDMTRGLVVVMLAVALWAWPGGTMDNWLMIHNPTIGPPSSAAYWLLLVEYVFWAVAIAVAVAVSAWWSGRTDGDEERSGWRGVLQLDSTRAALREGITALVVTVLVAGVLVLFLTGPRYGHTYRGQVYFAVAVGFVVAVIAAQRVSSARGLLWYLPAPLLVGVIGAVVAAVKPGLGVDYENINIIPAWGLVRPLPVQMVSVGLVAVLLTLRTTKRLSSEEDRT